MVDVVTQEIGLEDQSLHSFYTPSVCYGLREH